MDTLQLLDKHYTLRCLSTADKSDISSYPGVEYTNIRKSTEGLVERGLRKLTGFQVGRPESQYREGVYSKRLYRLLREKVSEWKPDVIWFCYGTVASWSLEFLEECKIPYIIEVHGYDISEAFTKESYSSRFVDVANSARALICASNHTRNRCVLKGVKPDVCSVIRYALDAQVIRPRGLTKSDQPSFVQFGRLTEKKQPLVTLEAFKLVLAGNPSATMTFIGSGNLESKIKEQIKVCGLSESVRVLPAMSREQALAIVEQHWVYCQHSVTAGTGDQEGFALSPAEAALLELPVVSTFHNGIPEHVRNMETGILVTEYDIQAMAKAMNALIADETMRAQFGVNGRRWVSELCSPSQRYDAICRLIDEIS